jgi:hypothetical protein
LEPDGVVSVRSSDTFVDGNGRACPIAGNLGAISFILLDLVAVGMDESTESSDGLVMSDRMGRRGNEEEVSDSSEGDVAMYRICRLGNLPPPSVSSDGLAVNDEKVALLLALFVSAAVVLLCKDLNAAGGDRALTMGEALGLGFLFLSFLDGVFGAKPSLVGDLAPCCCLLLELVGVKASDVVDSFGLLKAAK